MPFKPSDELVMRFTASEWNQIIGQLQEGPYKIVAPLISKMNIQAVQQEKQQQEGAQEPIVAGDITYTNGELAAVPNPFSQG